MFVCSGIYGLYSNYEGTDCLDPEDIKEDASEEWFKTHCIKGLILSYSLANKRTNVFAIEK